MCGHAGEDVTRERKREIWPEFIRLLVIFLLDFFLSLQIIIWMDFVIRRLQDQSFTRQNQYLH